jgi:sensor histidine kinase YesM
MILQPFVENSIWHGILHNEESGTISINISKDNELVFEKRLDVIKIRILDDGVGLEASKTKKSNHTSKGMSIIKERLKLLAGDNPDYEYLKIENRSDNITGTLVTITLIPEQYKENHSEESSNSIPV